jgi:hypothetical protein
MDVQVGKRREGVASGWNERASSARLAITPTTWNFQSPVAVHPLAQRCGNEGTRT